MSYVETIPGRYTHRVVVELRVTRPQGNKCLKIMVPDRDKTIEMYLDLNMPEM